MMRKDELFEIVCKKGNADPETAERLIDEVVFLEEQMTELKKMPFVIVNPKNPAMQKTTPAAKTYKDLFQQYTNALKLLLKMSGKDAEETEEESPLRRWAKANVDSRQ